MCHPYEGHGWRGRGRVKLPSGPYYTRVNLVPTHRPRSTTNPGYFRSCCLVGSILSSLIKSEGELCSLLQSAKSNYGDKTSDKKDRTLYCFFYVHVHNLSKLDKLLFAPIWEQFDWISCKQVYHLKWTGPNFSSSKSSASPSWKK